MSLFVGFHWSLIWKWQFLCTLDRRSKNLENIILKLLNAVCNGPDSSKFLIEVSNLMLVAFEGVVASSRHNFLKEILQDLSRYQPSFKLKKKTFKPIIIGWQSKQNASNYSFMTDIISYILNQTPAVKHILTTLVLFYLVLVHEIVIWDCYKLKTSWSNLWV